MVVCEHFLIFSFWLHYWIAVDKLLDYPQDCLPRNCLLVGNAEVGNSECITHRMWSCINFCAVSAHNFLNDCRSCCIKSDNNNKVRCTEVGGTATEDRLVQEIFMHLVLYNFFVFFNLCSFLSFVILRKRKRFLWILCCMASLYFYLFFNFIFFVIVRQRKTFSDEEPFLGGFLGNK